MRTSIMYRYIEEYHRAKAQNKPKETDIPSDVVLKKKIEKK